MLTREDIAKLIARPAATAAEAEPPRPPGAPMAPRQGGYEGRLEAYPMAYQFPRELPWGAQPFYAEGQLILPGASGAAAAVGTAATAVANASGLSVASSAIDATIASFVIPARMVAVVTGYWARPLSRLGARSGHVQFSLKLGGNRPTSVPTRLLGLRGRRDDPVPANYVVGAEKTISLLGTNGSTATWHAVEGWLEGWIVDESTFRRIVTNNV